MLVRHTCPACGSHRPKKNAHTRHGTHQQQCKACDRQVVATAEGRIIADEQRPLMAHLLRERLSLRGICRAVGVSLAWLWHLMVERFAACPDALYIRVLQRPTAVVLRRLEADADERGSLVQKTANKPWSWIAMDATTRQGLAFHGGDRRRDSAKELWATIPLVDRDQATCHPAH